MNNHAEIASDRGGAKPTPHPPEQRRRVFVPRNGYVHRDHQLEEAWARWGGETEFLHDANLAGECGICIFTRGSLGPNNELAQQVKPFFDRHGLESDVFEYDDAAQIFRRINPEWLATYYKREGGSDNWDRFVEIVNRVDRSIKTGALPLRFDPALADRCPEAPLFEIAGYAVYRR